MTRKWGLRYHKHFMFSAWPALVNNNQFYTSKEKEFGGWMGGASFQLRGETLPGVFWEGFLSAIKHLGVAHPKGLTTLGLNIKITNGWLKGWLFILWLVVMTHFDNGWGCSLKMRHWTEEWHEDRAVWFVKRCGTSLWGAECNVAACDCTFSDDSSEIGLCCWRVVWECS